MTCVDARTRAPIPCRAPPAPSRPAPSAPGPAAPGPDGFERGPPDAAFAAFASPARLAPHVTELRQAAQGRELPPLSRRPGESVPPLGGATDAAATERARRSLRSAIDDVERRAYGSATAKLDGLLRGPGALDAQLGAGARERLETLRDQTRFVATMGGQPDLPPTAAQLRDHFARLRPSPSASAAERSVKERAATEAFQAYAKAFHKNDVRGRADVRTYPHGSLEDALRAGSCEAGERVGGCELPGGRRFNDCKGHAILGASLLGAAGFKLQRYELAQARGEPVGHAAAVLRSPTGAELVTSNAEVFRGPRALERAMQEGLGEDFDLRRAVRTTARSLAP